MDVVSSSLSAIHFGRQSAVTVAATKFRTALALVAGGEPEFNVKENQMEFPAPTARSTVAKSPDQRTGYRVPVSGSMLFHPRTLGMLLLGAGFKLTTVASTGYYTHTFVIANRSELILLSTILDLMSDDSVAMRRIIKDYRLTNLTLTDTPDETEISWDGWGASEAPFTVDTETFAAETSVQINPALGALTLTILGDSITSLVRGNTFTIEQGLSDNERFIWTSLQKNRQTSIGCSGSLTDIDIDFDLYRRLYYGAAAGTSVSLIPATGAITYTHQSPTVIGATVVPYSWSVAVPSAQFMMEVTDSQGEDFVRCSLNWKMIDDVATPITITLVNDVVSYVA